MVTFVTYVLIYTPLKTVTEWNTVVGAIPGALPPVIGWCAGSAADRVGEDEREVAVGSRRAVDRAEHAPLHARDRKRGQGDGGVGAGDWATAA